MLSKRVSQLEASPTLVITAKAKELKSKGVDVIGFGAGEPDFDTPDFIKEACIKALQDGKTKYSPPAGIPELREAVSEKLRRENKLNYEPSDIVITCGAKMALFLVFSVLLNQGDEVLLPTPYWVTYPEQIKLLEGKPVKVPTGKDFVLTVDLLKEYTTNKTKALVINSPNNPTGVVYPPEVLKEIATFCYEKGIFIISDECYEAFVYENAEFISTASFSDSLREITFTVNAFSKTYSMTGWRIGYVACPPPFVKAIASLNSQTISNATTFAQYGALEALKNPSASEYVNKMRLEFRKRRDKAYELLRSIPHISLIKPQGAFYLFPDFSYYAQKLGNDIKLAEELLERGKVACVPGSAFGTEGFLRISYAIDTESLEEGIIRISRTLENLS